MFFGDIDFLEISAVVERGVINASLNGCVVESCASEDCARVISLFRIGSALGISKSIVISQK